MGKILIRSKVQPSFPSDPVLGKKNVYSQFNPSFVTGFVDGEGCFAVSIPQRKNRKLGREVQPRFKITLHSRDKPVLVEIKNSLRVGQIYKHGPQSIQFVVTSIKELERVINHFDQYPLITKKRADFDILKKVFILMKRKEHLTPEGLRKIVALKAAMNLGLSEKLWKAFPDVVPVVRPRVETPKAIDPHWLAGFTTAEGCFFINIRESKKSSVGFQVLLIFQITQHIRDERLMTSLIELLQCGKIYKYRNAFDFRVSKFNDIIKIIIPFFQKYKIQGVKALDFADFCQVVELMKNKKHLTAEGLEEIKKIKSGMNTGIKFTAEGEEEKNNFW